MGLFLTCLVWMFVVAVSLTVVLACVARYLWRRGKSLEEL